MSDIGSLSHLLGLFFDVCGAIIVLAPDWEFVDVAIVRIGGMIDSTPISQVFPFRLFVRRSRFQEIYNRFRNQGTIESNDPIYEWFHEFVSDNYEKIGKFDVASQDQGLVNFTIYEEGLMNSGKGHVPWETMKEEIDTQMTILSMRLGSLFLILGFSLQGITPAMRLGPDVWNSIIWVLTNLFHFLGGVSPK